MAISFGLKELLAAAIITAPVITRADSVTYDFAGTVTSASGVYSSAASTVSGTFTVDYRAAIPSQSTGTVGSTSGLWSAASSGGSYYGTATPAQFVFSSKLSSGGISYAFAPSSVYSYSQINGNNDLLQNSGNWDAHAGVYTNGPNSYLENDIALVSNTSVPFDANGLPVFSNVTSQQNELLDVVNDGVVAGQLQYTITSLSVASSPVPLPASAWLLLSGGVGIGTMIRKRRTA